MIQFGLDRLLADPALRRPLAGKRVALLAHPASVTRNLEHAIDALAALPDIQLSAAFGPQHGLRGDKQDNMVESSDYFDPQHGIPVFSLYGEVRRPTATMMDRFDVLLVDLQDLGCRIYTFITTLRYVLEAAARHKKAVWVLDRPNPAGRPVEGTLLQAGWESFVGAGPLPMRHGMTMGELARWFIATLKLDVECEVITMTGWEPDAAPGYGWPVTERSWINPSPNAPNLSMARAYAGTVMLEGTTLSEGRGTTRPLELFGAPDIDARQVIAHMQAFAPKWLAGCRLRECWFEPALPQAAAGQPLGRKGLHVGDHLTGIDVRRPEQLQRSGGATPFRQGRALQHHRARIGPGHGKVGGVGAGVDPAALGHRPAVAGGRIRLPAGHGDHLALHVELEGGDEPAGQLAHGHAMAHGQRPGADKALPARLQQGALHGPARGVGAVEYPHGLLVPGGGFEHVAQGGDEGVDAATQILQIDQQHVEAVHHRRGGPAHLAVQAEHGDAVLGVEVVGGLDHVVLLVPAQAVLGPEGRRQLDVGQGRQGVDGVLQIAGDGGRMGEQGDPLARQGAAQGRVGEEAVETELDHGVGAGKARAKPSR